MPFAVCNHPTALGKKDLPNMANVTRRHIPKQPPVIINNVVHIPTPKGIDCLVDMVDIDLTNNYWMSDPKGYISRGVWNRETKQIKDVRIHRLILERMLGRVLVKTEIADHIDGNPSNNRRSNIRLADRSGNNRNAKLRKDNQAKLKGVDWHKKTQKWRARIRVNKKLIHLGLFDDKYAAYSAYCEAAKTHFGEFARYE